MLLLFSIQSLDKAVSFFHRSVHIADQTRHITFNLPQFRLQRSNSASIQVMLEK